MIKKEISAKVEKIINTTDLKVNSYKTTNKGAESLIIEVNNQWIFRFPRNPFFINKINKRLNFLISFSKISPLKVPTPKYIEKSFIGYKKIPGKPLCPTNIERLNEKDRLIIAKQLGLFLKTLHSYKNKYTNFDTGYLVMRKKDYNTCPKAITKYLNKKERVVLKDKFELIKNNPLNFKNPTSIIHGDLHFNNMLWNPDKKVVTGIIDWAEAGLGMPAMDFIALADFNRNNNDKFLKNVLYYYGAKGNDLFFQIKENAIIEVMNWFWWYKKNQQPKGMARVIKKLKRILSQ